MKRTVKVSSRGQVVIPAEMRRELDLERDSRLEVEVDGETLVFRPIRKQEWDRYRGALGSGTSLTKALEDERLGERQREDDKFDDL
jgi:AbrB family looped-hinge helix DNA binding protein